VDRSGSMNGNKWNKAVQALQSCVAVMGEGDRAMITFFESKFRDFSEGPLPAHELRADSRFQELQRVGTAGGTELAPALRHVLEAAARHSAGRDRNLILITDAQIGNDRAILDLMRSAPDMPVHCFGIDIALNDALLLALSRQQGGSFHSLNPNDDIQAAVTALGRTLRQPVLLQPQLSEGWECADARIPNLYAARFSTSTRGRRQTSL
jgi:Ca-activated chloride channel family protein